MARNVVSIFIILLFLCLLSFISVSCTLGYMLAGLWGAKNYEDREMLKDLGLTMLTSTPRNYWDYDQALLRRIVWPYASKSALQHDSYFCKFHKTCKFSRLRPCRPFPTKRPNRQMYVGWSPVRQNGNASNSAGLKKCPISCRPKDHRDWTYCWKELIV